MAHPSNISTDKSPSAIMSSMSEKPDRRQSESHSDFGEIAIAGSDFGEITDTGHSPRIAMPFLPLARWRERGPGGEGGTARNFPNPIMLTDPAIHPSMASSLPDSS